jgi:pSer/pThr/pTyr-binding forkhead associated (FHA) protein
MSAAVEVSTALAKVSWQDPQTGETRELILQEGARASIGRLESNDICIREQHVSRQHAFIEYQDGVFFVSDNASANGVFVNDERITEPFPLIAGDVIRLFVPLIQFKAVIGGETVASGEHLSTAHGAVGRGRLIMMGGPQEGTAIPLRWQSLRVGRATANAEWEVCIPDPSISRPHARMEFVDDNWIVYDLGSSNGTMVNNTPVNEKGRMLRDGDMVTFGMSTLLFRNS